MGDSMNDSIMLQNIREQPRVVTDCLAIDLPLPGSFLSAQRIMLLACGSSRHAGLVAQHWFETIAKIPVQVLDAADWTDRSPLVESNTLIIALSQSGKTKDLLEALAQIKAVNREIQVLAIVNAADSPLVHLADASIVTPAGPEGAVAATKSFSAQLAILARITVNLAEYKSLVSTSLFPVSISKLCTDLELLPEAIVKSLDHLQHQIGKGVGLDWMVSESIVLLGRGIQQPIALEGALKLKETAYVHAEGFGAGDFCHGPMAILKPGFPIIALMPDLKMRSDLHRFQTLGCTVIGIGKRGHDCLRHDCLLGLDQVFELESIADWLMPFLIVLPLQLLACDWARSRGLDVDQPRYLTKFIG